MHTLEALEFYTQYHPRWFEGVQRYAPTCEYTGVYADIMPQSWVLNRSGLWYSASPRGAELPEQGWKLHISVSTRDSVSVLRRILPLLRDDATPFKFLLDPFVTALANGKLWPRGSSGKFVTIYPASLASFYRLGHSLQETLVSYVGPYILSDRRWPNSRCVYYRYGGFTAHPELQVDGTREYVIASPSGDWVPDLRSPYWSPPAWAGDPFPESGKKSPDKKSPGTEKTLCNGRYLVTSALSFSNRGGVYKGVDNRTGQAVVIKEARSCVELGRHQLDAISLLEKEYRLLQRLAGTRYFVRPVDFFWAWEHAFLVEAYVPGEHFGRFTIRNNPLYSGDVTPATVDAYFVQLQPLWLQLAQAIAAAHQAGIVLNDLSFTNILVHEGRIQICDLETSTEEGFDTPVGLYTPGMAASGISDHANDYYALGAIVFGSVMLAHGIAGFYPPSRRRFVDDLTVDMGLPNELIALIDDLMERPEQQNCAPRRLEQAIEQLPFGRVATARTPRLALPIEQRFDAAERERLFGRVAETVSGITDYLLNTADPSRQDRLFPADPAVFETNPLSIAYGAMGILYALKRIAGAVPKPLIDWVTRHRASSTNDYPPGLYLGQAGIAWAFCELGLQELAVQILRSARQHKLLWKSPNVFYGAAGYGLTCLKLWNDGAGNEFLGEAVRVGEHLRVSCKWDEQGAYWPNPEGAVPLGYAYGGSGIALFLLYLSLATRDAAPGRLGRQALDFELAQGVWQNNAFVGFPTYRTERAKLERHPDVLNCYWDVGSSGVGTTLIRYLEVFPDTTLRDWLGHLVSDASRKYTAFPQLFRGAAGLGNFLLDAWQQTGDERMQLAAWHAAEAVLLFRIDCAEGIAFPGEQTRRETADVATGAAGVGLFLDRLHKSGKGSQRNFNFVLDGCFSSGRHVASEPFDHLRCIA